MTGTPIALVTGATAGLGRAVAGVLADHNAIALLINNAEVGAGPVPAGHQPLSSVRA
jgi:NAD(P)-dependent dehydrogenase (short-subunit alcohol dehydrogenase family)